jgi:hypothetical protein
MMVWRCGGCVPSCLFLGATELKSCKKKSTDKQTDLTVIWDTKSTKTDFLSDPKSVDRKTKKLDRRADRQSADLVFWDTLLYSKYVVCKTKTYFPPEPKTDHNITAQLEKKFLQPMRSEC